MSKVLDNNNRTWYYWTCQDEEARWRTRAKWRRRRKETMSNKTMWRFNMNHRVTAFEMPEGAVVRSFGMTSHGPCFWAEVDPTAKPTRKVFAAVKTGASIPEEATGFVGTCHVPHTTAIHLFAMPDDTEILQKGHGTPDEDASGDDDSPDEDENNS